MAIDFSQHFVAEPPGAGVHKVKIVSVEKTITEKGNDRLRFEAAVLESNDGDALNEGCVIRDGFNLPQAGESGKGMRDMWMRFLISMGYEQKALREHGQFDESKCGQAGAFECILGKEAWVRYTPADPENGARWPKTRWLTERQAGSLTVAHAAMQTAVAESSSGATVSPLDKVLAG